MPEPLSNAHTGTKLTAQNLQQARVIYREKLGLDAVQERTATWVTYAADRVPSLPVTPPGTRRDANFARLNERLAHAKPD